MTLPLRQRHRRIFYVLAVFIPVVFVIGVAARRPVPAVSRLPAEIAGTQPVFQAIEWARSDPFPKVSIQLRLLRESTDKGHYAIGFSAPKDFTKPDLIVYWVEGTTTITDKLPENALLLGAFDPLKPLPISDQIQRQTGVLVLYSLADAEIVEVSKPLRFNDSTL